MPKRRLPVLRPILPLAVSDIAKEWVRLESRREVVERRSDWERILERLPAGWEERAREHKAFERRREVQSPGDLLRLVLG